MNLFIRAAPTPMTTSPAAVWPIAAVPVITPSEM